MTGSFEQFKKYVASFSGRSEKELGNHVIWENFYKSLKSHFTATAIKDTEDVHYHEYDSWTPTIGFPEQQDFEMKKCLRHWCGYYVIRVKE